MGEKKCTAFLTGATGLVGSYLLKILLQNGHKVYCLARGKKDESAQKRVEDVLNFWDDTVVPNHSEQLIVLEGDIVHEDLGLDEKTRDLLKNEVEQIFHSAAVTDVNWEWEIIEKINVGGTRNVLNLALFFQREGLLKRFNHLSTAFVFGDYQGVFTEEDLDVGQNFITTYERSKFEAEKLVNESRDNSLEICIFRPSLIVGESTKEGKTFQFKHIYQCLQMCALEIVDFLPGKDSLLSLVTVDGVAEAIYLISTHSNIEKVYHIFNSEMSSVGSILESLKNAGDVKMPELISQKEAVSRITKLTPIQKKILIESTIAMKYCAKLNSDRTTRELLNLGFSFPSIKSIFINFFQEKLIKKSVLANNRGQ